MPVGCQVQQQAGRELLGHERATEQEAHGRREAALLNHRHLVLCAIPKAVLNSLTGKRLMQHFIQCLPVAAKHNLSAPWALPLAAGFRLALLQTRGLDFAASGT